MTTTAGETSTARYVIRAKLADDPESSRGVIVETHVLAERVEQPREDYERAGCIVFVDAEQTAEEHDDEEPCHCGAGLAGSDHCPQCFCEQGESVCVPEITED